MEILERKSKVVRKRKREYYGGRNLNDGCGIGTKRLKMVDDNDDDDSVESEMNGWI